MQTEDRAHWAAVALQKETLAGFQHDGALQSRTARPRAQIWEQDIGLAEAPLGAGCYHPLCGSGRRASGTMAVFTVRGRETCKRARTLSESEDTVATVDRFCQRAMFDEKTLKKAQVRVKKRGEDGRDNCALEPSHKGLSAMAGQVFADASQVQRCPVR